MHFKLKKVGKQFGLATIHSEQRRCLIKGKKGDLLKQTLLNVYRCFRRYINKIITQIKWSIIVIMIPWVKFKDDTQTKKLV